MNQGVRSLTKLGALVILALVAFSPASAQTPTSQTPSSEDAIAQTQPLPTPPAEDMPARIEPYLAVLQNGLDEIEADLTRIEKRARVVPGDERVEAMMDQVTKSVSDALRMLVEAARQPDDAVLDKAKIRESFPSAFLEFEKAARGFRDRAMKIGDRLFAIQQGITEGRIVLDLEVFDKTTARDRVEFMKTLAPRAQDIYRKMSPAKFSGVDFHLQRFAMVLGSAVKDACLPDAKAAVAAGCVGTCVYGAWELCAACVAVVVPGVYLATLDWYRAQCNCCRCRSWKPWCCACRVGCWIAFAAWVA